MGAPPPFTIQVTSGDGLVDVRELDLDWVSIGRDPRCELCLDSTFVSRRHAELHRRGARFILVALDTPNGTFLNGEPVSGRIELSDGDAIGIGRYRLELRMGVPEAPPQARRGVLVGESGEERLSLQEPFQIGKDPACSLQLTSWFAPRKACLIVRDGFRYLLVNVSPSPKGVLVNGEPVLDRRELHDGDRLEVYGRSLRFVRPQGRDLPGDAEPRLEGTFHDADALQAVLQILDLRDARGVLRVAAEGTSARLWIDSGRILAARAGSTVGEAALGWTLSRARGEFSFHRCAPQPEEDERVEVRILRAVLEFARATDEAQVRLRPAEAFVDALAPVGPAPARRDLAPANAPPAISSPPSPTPALAPAPAPALTTPTPTAPASQAEEPTGQDPLVVSLRNSVAALRADTQALCVGSVRLSVSVRSRANALEQALRLQGALA